MTVSPFDINAFGYGRTLDIPADGASSTVALTNVDANIEKLYYSTLSATASNDTNGDGNFNVGEKVTLTDHVGPAQNTVKFTKELTVLGSGAFTWTSGLAPGYGGTADVLVTTDGTRTYLLFVNGTQASHTANNNDPSGASGPRFGELINSSSLTWKAVGYQPGSGPLCFCRDTMIETDRGPVAGEELAVGDLVLTRDNGPQPVRWLGATRLGADRLTAEPQFRPIRIRAGALGQGVPAADLVVSPQHRVLVRSRIAERIGGNIETLIAARQLLGIDGVGIADDLDEVEYFHMLFDRHEVITSNGAATESLFTGPMALRSLSHAARAEVMALFPELRSGRRSAAPARVLLKGRQARALVSRHRDKGRALVHT